MTDSGVLITVLYGGVGPEREVSLASGPAVVDGLSRQFDVRGIDVRERALPPSLDPVEGVVFPILHGEFGEDGGLQTLLEKGRFEYAGSDSISSALCMDKAATKQRVAEVGVRGPEGIVLEPGSTPDFKVVREQLGDRIVVKPVNGGSSSALSVLDGPAELRAALDEMTDRRWLMERFIEGREVSVGVLEGIAQGVVEVIPKGGVYDYRHKYTPGSTEYRWPAVLEPSDESALRKQAETVFAVCGCRDFARVDFRLAEDGPWFLEINTLPGMTSESLLPKSADCMGLSFEDLTLKMVEPALDRFQRRLRRMTPN